MSIELKKVSKRFVDNVVLDGVDFFVAEGETVALLGPSGVGKSVLLKHIIGLIKPDSGEVWVDGQQVPLLGRKELAALRSRIGYVFQNGALFDSMDVFENIRLGITDEKLYADKEDRDAHQHERPDSDFLFVREVHLSPAYPSFRCWDLVRLDDRHLQIALQELLHHGILGRDDLFGGAHGPDLRL